VHGRDAAIRRGLAQALADSTRVANQALEALDVDHDMVTAARGHTRRHRARDVDEHTHIRRVARRR
jgi:hypothetical protein